MSVQIKNGKSVTYFKHLDQQGKLHHHDSVRREKEVIQYIYNTQLQVNKHVAESLNKLHWQQ